MGDQVVPLSYLLRERQRAVADALGIWWEFFAGPPFMVPWKRDHWTRDDMRFYETSDWGMNIVFEFAGFDPDQSQMVYGDPVTLGTSITDHPNATLLFDNRSHKPELDIDLSQSVTLLHSRSSDTSTRIAWDVGVKAKGTIGGEAVGATLETEVSANFGITTNTSQAESQSTSKTVSQDVRTKVPGYTATLCKFSSPRNRQRTPFDVRGYPDGAFTLQWNPGLHAGNLEQLCHGPRYSEPGGKRALRFEGFSDFYDMLMAYNVDFPGQVDNLNPSARHAGNPDTHAAMEAARLLVWSGTIETVADESVLVSFEDVTDPDSAIEQYGITSDRIIRPS